MAARRRRDWITLAGWVFAAAAGLVAALVLAIDLGWQRDRIASLALDLARERLGTEVDVARVTGRLSRGLVLEDLRVGPEADPLIEAARVDVRWSLRALAAAALAEPAEAEWIAERLRLADVRVFLRRTAEGRWPAVASLMEALNAPTDAPDTTPSAERPRLRVRRIAIERITLDVHLEPDPRLATSGAPWRLLWRASGEGRELRIDPDEPLEIDRLTVRGALAAPTSGGPVPLEAADATITLEERRIEAARLSVTGPDFVARAEARGQLDELEAVEVALDAARLDVLVPFLAPWLVAPESVTGELHVEAQLRGPPTALVGRVAIEATGLRDGARRVDAFEGEATFDRPLWPWPDRLEAIEAEIAFDATRVALADLTPGDWPSAPLDARGRGRVSAGRLTLDDASLAIAGLRAKGRGQGSTSRIERLEASFEIDALAPWNGLLLPDRTLGGSARGTLDVAGPREAPGGRLAVVARDLVVDGRSIGRLDVVATREAGKPGGRGAAKPIDLVVDGSDGGAKLVRGSARVDVAAEAAHFTLETGPALAFALAPPGPLADAAAKAEGSVERKGEDYALHLTTFDVRAEAGRLALEAPLTARLAGDGAWSLEAPAVRLGPPPRPATADAEPPPDAAANGEGTIALAAKGRSDRIERIETRIESLPAALVLRHVPDWPLEGGVLSGRLRVDLVATRSQRADGDLTWRAPRVGGVAFERFALSLDDSGDALQARIAAQLEGLQPLEATARLPVGEGALAIDLATFRERVSLDVELDRFELSVLAPLLPVSPRWLREPSGALSGRLEIPAGAGARGFQGRLRLAKGSVTLPLLGQRFSPIRGEVVLDARALRIDGLRIGGDGRGARFDGTVDLNAANGHPIEGVLDLDHFPLARARLVTADVDGAIELRGSLELPVVRGDLALEETRIRVPAADDPVLKEIRIVSQDRDARLVESVDAPANAFDRSDLEVTLRVPPSTRIRGQGAQLFVEGAATASREPGEPLRLRGEARVVNGTYTFQGRQFRVRRGRVTLVGDERLDPVLDIEATRAIQDIVAIVEVSGRLSEPIVRLRSEPERSEQDVLAYLLFGRPASEVGAAQGGRFDATAARLFAGVAERELREVLGDAMPVDSIEIGADEAGNTSELGFGKYIGPNVFIRYVHTLGDEPADSVGVEYRVNDLFSVGSSVSTTGDAGLDLILRYDF